MLIDLARDYLTSTVKTPFFLFISDGQYLSALDELKVCGLTFVPLSDFCCNDDKIPDIDGLISYIEAADINAKGKRFVVTGLGEFLALRGNNEATRVMSRLKNQNVGGAKVIFLLRGLASLISGLQNDPRFDSRRHCVVDKAECDLSFTLVSPMVGLSALSGFKAMLVELENGQSGNIVVNTVVNLSKAMFTVHVIDNAYDGIAFSTRGFALERSCGSDAQWGKLLNELNQCDFSIDSVYDKYGFNEDPSTDFYSLAAGNDYHNWLYFVFLKSKRDVLRNGYLRFVLNKTSCFSGFVSNVLNAIADISHTDRRFASFYQERKALVQKFPESDIANFVVNNRLDVSESIFRLTDQTRVEREEIVAWLTQNGMVPKLDDIYPVLSDYLKKYVFKNTELSDLLTDYFESYKRQKIANALEPEFLDGIDELALSRKFNRLPSRDEIIGSIDKDNAYLYWLDALGVEYLSLIESLAQKRGLSIRINIARAELPTITSINKGFYESWESGKKEKNDKLDGVKHKESGGYNFTNNELPIHIAKELEIIVSVIDKAATELALRRCKRFIVASDHGASRLAVLRRKEEKYDTDTVGEHSGRCCKLFHPYDLPFAAEENGYLVLADYGRFRGSRAANVEVHGGAALEEVVVPIIELALKDGSITVQLVENAVTVDYRTGAKFKLFFNAPVESVSIVINGKPYPAVQIDRNHFSVEVADMKRAGEYFADVYAGDNLIGKITVKAQGKSGKVNDAFDELF